MKKSELTQLTHIIEHLVAREVRKQLPAIIAETFQNMMGKSIVTERKSEPRIQEPEEIQESRMGDTQTDFKASLRELFSGTPVMKTPSNQSQPKQTRQFTKDPVLNQILNETTSDLRDRERLVGAAAFVGGYSPSLNMVPGFNPQAASMQPEEADPSFLKNVPTMVPNHSAPSRPQVFQEGESAPIPIPSNVPPAVAGALTRNYSQMMKLIDKKKKGIA